MSTISNTQSKPALDLRAHTPIDTRKVGSKHKNPLTSANQNPLTRANPIEDSNKAAIAKARMAAEGLVATTFIEPILKQAANRTTPLHRSDRAAPRSSSHRCSTPSSPTKSSTRPTSRSLNGSRPNSSGTCPTRISLIRRSTPRDNNYETRARANTSTHQSPPPSRDRY